MLQYLGYDHKVSVHDYIIMQPYKIEVACGGEWLMSISKLGRKDKNLMCTACK